MSHTRGGLMINGKFVSSMKITGKSSKRPGQRIMLGMVGISRLLPQGNNLNVPRKFFAIPAGRVFESTTSPHFFPAHANSNG